MERLIRWPDGWGPRFTVFADVEEEFDWSRPFSREANATTAIPALLPFAEKMATRGVGVTYLADFPVVTAPSAVETLRRIIALPGAEIGTQLHPWVNPPFDEIVSPRNSFVGNLPAALEAAKLDQLTEAITAAVGVRPRAYRAGRYGIGRNTAELLTARGYRLDTSVRAGFDYRRDGGPDFRSHRSEAAWIGEGLIELPLSTINIGPLRRAGARLYDLAGRVPRLRGVLARTGLLSRVPLTPEGTSPAEAVAAITQAVSDGSAVLNISFHSPSLVPGHTPYVRSAADLAAFHAWWDRVLDHLDRVNVRPASLADLLAAACPPQSPSATAQRGVGL